jgi:hypothetical protein
VYDLFDGPGYDETVFNITEDMNIDEYEIDISSTNTRPRYDVTSLLSAQLPAELPTVDKDLFILMVAYYGVINRYARLGEKRSLRRKSTAVCTASTITLCLPSGGPNKQFPESGRGRLRKAIYAQFIMSNMLSTMTLQTHNLPYLIWYPTLARLSTYRELAQRKPQMKLQVLRAAVVANYPDLFDELLNDVTPDKALIAKHPYPRTTRGFWRGGRLNSMLF